MTELIAPLGINHDANLHGDFEAFDRLELVNDLKRNGDGVAYLGYVLHDLPALTHADISICLDIDSDSAITGSICDITLGADVHWLPRIIQLSRNIEKTASSNFTLLAGSSFATAVGAATAIINPLSTVLLSNIPFLISELRNLSAMNSHGVFETAYEKERAIPPLPPKHPKCRIPSGSGHQRTMEKSQGKSAKSLRTPLKPNNR
jgi:cation transport ATPase